MKRTLTAAMFLLFCAGTLLAQPKRPLELADMFKMQRISEPAVSPDGTTLVYTVTTPDVEANRNFSDLWSVPVTGGVPKQLTTDPASDRHAVWSPDGKWIAFESTRSGESQIWLMRPDGSDQKQLTTISTGASTAYWSPDGKMIAFVSDVFPENSEKPYPLADSLNRIRVNQLEKGKVKAKLLTQLFYRSWDSWVDGKRQQVFVISPEGGDPVNVTPLQRDGVPRSTTFSVGTEFDISPDGKELAHTASPMITREEAWSTNYDIWLVPFDGTPPRRISTNAAADGSPRYSPDGKYIAYRAQSTPGFEADRWQLMLFDRATSESRSLTATFDSHVDEFVWSPDSKMLYFTAEERGNKPIWSVSLAGNDVKKMFDNGTNGSIAVTHNSIFFSHATAVRPAEIYSIGRDGRNLKQITKANDALFAALEIPAPEAAWFKGAGGTNVHTWIFKPPRMVSGAKYPMVYLVHGGPQGAWLNGWSYRWNPALWAAQGYVVVAPNPRGSSGFGQQFMNEISRDWSGKVFIDLMRGADFACSLPYVDSTRKAAAGASFGGYMINWFGAKTGNRFNALLSHSGIYNNVSMYGTTEELWFEEWEHGIPWEVPTDYAKSSPHTFAKDFKAPMLITHGERDYRVPVQQSMEMFTMLQRRGIPSKFLYFPDENHWILKPGNSKLWHETVFDWLREYLRKGDAPQ